MSTGTPTGLGGTSRFPTTSWSLILDARDPRTDVSREALGALCCRYWQPVYSFVRRRGFDIERARDYTQGFFAVLLEKDYLADVDQSKGRFRSFLLASVKHFVSNQLDMEKSLKRGGGLTIQSLEWESAEGTYRLEPADRHTPESLFEYHWVMRLLARTLESLRATHTGPDFDRLKPFLQGDAGRGRLAVVAEELGMSEPALRMAAHRLRSRYRAMLRAEVEATVAGPAQAEDEIRYLMSVLARNNQRESRPGA